MKLATTITSFLLIILFSSCRNSDPNFDYVELRDFKYQKALLATGTEIQILSFSGGKECSPKESYYYQFIGIDKSTGDTVRILAPCQKIDLNLNPSVGSYTPWDSTESIINKELRQNGESNFISENIFVVFNKQNAILEKREFKTAIGSLSFGNPTK